ncbi:twin-arginine translocase TatA/TatE family subunit [Fodinicurvata halophila]|uniref:Sec-independent protein translocase protein TatA n=1 Tax=Fodinicurvata halophila TaxID=1419723 RepID=A0ABV8ULG5_9PROT
MGVIPSEDILLVAFTGSFSIWHWLIVLAVVLILFGGGGKIPKLMKDLGSGITQFKRGMKEEDKSDENSEDENGEKPALNRDETSTAQSEKVDEEKKQKAANG